MISIFASNLIKQPLHTSHLEKFFELCMIRIDNVSPQYNDNTISIYYQHNGYTLLIHYTISMSCTIMHTNPLLMPLAVETPMV